MEALVWIGTFVFGGLLASLLVWNIRERVKFETGNKEEVAEVIKCPFVVGKLYYINLEIGGTIEAVYLGLTMDGFRHFVNLETGGGMMYKRNDPGTLLTDKEVRVAVQPEIRR